MSRGTLQASLCVIFSVFVQAMSVSAQSPEPYPNAVSDRLIHLETAIPVPARNVVFPDPDFGSLMVRATDPTTNFKLPGTYLRTEGSGEANEWSVDSSKFYVVGSGGQTLAFGFNPRTMAISSLPHASPGKALLVPLRAAGSFSFLDPDLIYGTTNADPLTITSYRFSTGVSTPVIDTRTCGVQPPLGTGPSVVSDDDVRNTLNDTRFSISEGGNQTAEHMFVVVYDTNLGCRWYNTQTGQIGGAWGTNGTASVTSPYLIRHAYLSRNGKYVVILVDYGGWYVWDVSTLKVTACPIRSAGLECNGYRSVGYNTMVSGPGITGDMQTIKRSLSNIGTISQLVVPVDYNWEEVQQFTWNNVNVHDSTPVCGATHTYDGDPTITEPFAGEIFCIETDGLASTVWRFAHNRALYMKQYFQAQPMGNISRDGRFFLFTSTWDGLLGTQADGQPLSDVFIVKLK